MTRVLLDAFPSVQAFLSANSCITKIIFLISDLKMFGAQKQVLVIVTRGMSQHASRPSQMVDKFVRVDHAGELGADRIYAGQMAVLGKKDRKYYRKLRKLNF